MHTIIAQGVVEEGIIGLGGGLRNVYIATGLLEEPALSLPGSV